MVGTERDWDFRSADVLVDLLLLELATLLDEVLRRFACVLIGEAVTGASGTMGMSTVGFWSMPMTYLMNVAIARKQYLPGVVNAKRTGSVWAQSDCSRC